ETDSGAAVRDIVAELEPDLVVTDFQVGSMGAMAICLDLRLEESGDRIDHVPVLMLCDRRADVFLAKRAGAEGFIVKPLDPIRLRRAIRALLDGDSYHDESFKPFSVAATVAAGG
ncbi:MAG TPA: response regulator, partial [Acidimicrobiales bacterium]|nr:response regulator [Acidimicrobiales bacterium]